jgi:hypothetical protein
VDPDVAAGLVLQLMDELDRPPSTTRAFAHSRSSGVDVTTNFATALMNIAYGSIVLSGQNRAHSS